MLIIRPINNWCLLNINSQLGLSHMYTPRSINVQNTNICIAPEGRNVGYHSDLAECMVLSWSVTALNDKSSGEAISIGLACLRVINSEEAWASVPHTLCRLCLWIKIMPKYIHQIMLIFEQNWTKRYNNDEWRRLTPHFVYHTVAVRQLCKWCFTPTVSVLRFELINNYQLIIVKNLAVYNAF